jgi:hypothetical protein
MEDIERALERVKASLGEQDYEVLKNLVDAYQYVTELVGDKETSIKRLRKLLFGSKTEKTKEVLERAGGEEAAAAGGEDAGKDRPGETGAASDLAAGTDAASEEPGGAEKPGGANENQGEGEKKKRKGHGRNLRCNLCGVVFTARPPEGLGEGKYDATAASMMANLRYGSGFPLNRLENLQGNLRIPLPAATQWEIVEEKTGELEPF